MLADFEYTHDREHHRKTVRRLHQLNGSNQPKGEFYDYDSAYRLTDWKESWVIPDPIVIPAGGGTFTFSGSGSTTISVVQTGGFPIATQVRGVVGTATDTQNWTLDGVGNWEQMKRKGTATNNSADVFNQYTSWGGTAQSHDANGNLLDDGVYLYQYDFLNRMRTVTLKSTTTLIASYAYDAMNRRVETTVSSVSTRFLYDGWHAVEERVSGSVTKQFVYGQGLDEILKMDTYTSGSISTTHYYHTDALGSVIALTDSAGAIVERVKYSPYGQPYWMNASNQLLLDGSGNYVNASTVGNPLLFTAARYDAETANRTNSQITDATGAYCLRNRYLDSDKGRFTTRDPIGVWGDEVNLGGGQTYCGNDPVNGWDPLGLLSISGIHPLPISGKCEKEPEPYGPFLPEGAYWDANSQSWVTPLPTPGFWGTMGNWFEIGFAFASGFLEGAGDGVQSGLDTVNPFGDPYREGGYYDPSHYSTLDLSNNLFFAGTAIFSVIAMLETGGVTTSGPLMGRDFATGQRGILNNNDYLRVGWGWNGPADSGSQVFRIGIGSPSGPLPFHKHIDLYTK